MSVHTYQAEPQTVCRGTIKTSRKDSSRELLIVKLPKKKLTAGRYSRPVLLINLPETDDATEVLAYMKFGITSPNTCSTSCKQEWLNTGRTRTDNLVFDAMRGERDLAEDNTSDQLTCAVCSRSFSYDASMNERTTDPQLVLKGELKELDGGREMAVFTLPDEELSDGWVERAVLLVNIPDADFDATKPVKAYLKHHLVHKSNLGYNQGYDWSNKFHRQ